MVSAKKRGTRIRHGAAVQVMTYPRPRTKAVLVEASREVGLALSSFMVLASLKEAAALRGCGMDALGIQPDELRRYRRAVVVPKRVAAAIA